MVQTPQEFFHDFRQELLAGAEANCNYQLAEFMEAVTSELLETGFVEGFEFCHFRAQRGMRVDGYWFNDEDSLDLFVADFNFRDELLSLTKTEAEAAFKRVINFFHASKNKKLYLDLEVTSPEYSLARQIADRCLRIHKINFFLLSERSISDRIQEFPDNQIDGIAASYHIWDISRLHRQRSSRGHKEPLDINIQKIFGKGISCLPAHLGLEKYKSYLVVMPGSLLSALYEKFGARLLEQNVRCFLQARGNVNKGIRATILNEPQMFFAYNNGITATAQEVECNTTDAGLEIIRIKDLQIVNGGQTTASLFHTQRKDTVSLESIFVQMKLAVINSLENETVVPRISEYANTQNRINAADFFSNHPFHIRIEEFSRRIWAPAKEGEQRETKWFYERARGQYADAQTNLTQAEKKRFKAENPKSQMFTKTDLAKFENVWDEHPKWVNFGAQKNFARYAGRIGAEWTKSSDDFSEFYYRRIITRALIFRATEKLVSTQSWYNGGYRANIVAYTIASLSEICRRIKKALNINSIWSIQRLPQTLIDSIVIAAKFVNHDIVSPPSGISNVGEWCKKDLCWERIAAHIEELEEELPSDFNNILISIESEKIEEINAKKIQKLDDGIVCQKNAISLGADKWKEVAEFGLKNNLLNQKDMGILQIAVAIPEKIPSEKQCIYLMSLLKRLEIEGLRLN